MTLYGIYFVDNGDHIKSKRGREAECPDLGAFP